jgi:uncharacterized protein (TIGR02300 family)
MEAPIFKKACGARLVAKPNLGLKRVCGSCGTKFYDFARSPIICPKCGTVYVVSSSAARAASRAAEAAAVPVAEEPELPVAGAEVISLEEAEAETTGKKKPATADVDADGDDDVEVEAGDEDDTFLEEEEEEPGDVSDIIGEKLEEDRET